MYARCSALNAHLAKEATSERHFGVFVKTNLNQTESHIHADTHTHTHADTLYTQLAQTRCTCINLACVSAWAAAHMKHIKPTEINVEEESNNEPK